MIRILTLTNGGTLTNLSDPDRRSVLLALSMAISHETAILSRLQADEEFRSFKESIEQRRQQIETFESLLRKLLATLLTASTYLVVRGFDNMYEGLYSKDENKRDKWTIELVNRLKKPGILGCNLVNWTYGWHKRDNLVSSYNP